MFNRHRRLRANSSIRSLVRENHLNINDLVYPIFVIEGQNIKNEIPSMPNIFQFSLDNLLKEIEEINKLGILAIMLFGVPLNKDFSGSSASDSNGIVQKAIKLIKKEFPDMYVIADTCLCQYTDHGHCGILNNQKIENDSSLIKLSEVALSYADAGADMIAPSNMMDGFVYSIRKVLDNNNFYDIPIMSYAVKYSSSFYGPFREAVDSAPSFGDRKTYQMDVANAREAILEAETDIKQGADIIMVKPGLAYMDIIKTLRETTSVPLAVYNVSGEYSMIKAASLKGWIDERKVVEETMISFKRAGTDIIVTYHAKDIANWTK